MAQLVKNPPAMWETGVQSLGWEDPLRKERLPTLVLWPGESHGLYSPWGGKESDMTEQLSLHFTSRIQRWLTQVSLVIKNLPANAGDARDTGSIPGLGRSPGVENGNLLQYSCQDNPVDRGD